jgi:hypothetical protein
MGLLNRKPTTPPTVICPWCSKELPVEGSSKMDHWETHLIQVTDNNGDRAFIFRCPCGVEDGAWGAGESLDKAKFRGACGIAAHLMERHGISP